jgi:hypothetical protein
MSKFDDPGNEGPIRVFFVPSEDAEDITDEVIGELFDEVADAFDHATDEEIERYLNGAAHLRPVLRFGKPTADTSIDVELDLITPSKGTSNRGFKARPK